MAPSLLFLNKAQSGLTFTDQSVLSRVFLGTLPLLAISMVFSPFGEPYAQVDVELKEIVFAIVTDVDVHGWSVPSLLAVRLSSTTRVLKLS